MDRGRRKRRRAADSTGRSPPIEAARIFTGAPVPAGADSVLIQEEAARDGVRLTMTGEGPLRAGGNVRPRATDFAIGAPLVAAGQRISARHVALAGIGGHGTIRSAPGRASR